MCRLLAYLGPKVSLGRLVSEPEHSLVVQSYKPKEMTSGTVNADGFGFAWYDRSRQPDPFAYRNTAPIWSDENLGSLGAFVESDCILANVRSATPGQSIGLANTQPFMSGRLSALHNGFVEDFRDVLHGPIRRGLDDRTHAAIKGTTDSEHLFAWLLPHLDDSPSLLEGLRAGLRSLLTLEPDAKMTLNFIVSDGERLVASRLAAGVSTPTLYVLDRHDQFPDAVLIASEPIFADDRWQAIPERGLVSVDPERIVTIDTIDA